MTRHGYIAAGLLCVMFILGMSSMVGNSAIMDEVAHIPAAYSYLHYGDYRLNPEHPPLIKDLAAIPLQFMRLKFPINRPDWTSEVNGEWDVGWDFLYNMGNNADAILFWARLPILFLSLGFGLLLYVYCRKFWGTAVALLALTFYVLSPNMIANSILVTTDLGAAIFIFIGLIGFARFMREPTRTNMWLMSLAIAGAQLAKFSGVVLYPFLGLMTLAMVWLGKKPERAMDRLRVYTGSYLVACLLSVAWVWLFYTPEVWNMPTYVQVNLINGMLVAPNNVYMAHILVGLSKFTIFSVPIFKPIVQFVLGVTMVLGRVAGGNVTYFNGQVNDSSFHAYFFETFMFKTQVALILMMFGAMAVSLWRAFRKQPKRLFARFRGHVLAHFTEWTLGAFSVFYFAIAVGGNLDLGVRHILPIYLPIFVLVAIVIVKWLRVLLATPRWQITSGLVFAALMVWYAASTLINAPNYLSYFNELAGGPGNAYKYFSDSSVDWGQDLKRLVTYVDEHPQIHHIAIDYFGGGMPQYYFCQRLYDSSGNLIATSDGYDCSHSKIELWHSQYGRYTGQYIAVSETYLENDRYYSGLAGVPGYAYLRAMKPIAKVGNSIYVYKLY